MGTELLCDHASEVQYESSYVHSNFLKSSHENIETVNHALPTVDRLEHVMISRLVQPVSAVHDDIYMRSITLYITHPVLLSFMLSFCCHSCKVSMLLISPSLYWQGSTKDILREVFPLQQCFNPIDKALVDNIISQFCKKLPSSDWSLSFSDHVSECDSVSPHHFHSCIHWS